MSNLLNDSEFDEFRTESTFNNEDIADACRLLGLSGPLEALLRGIKIEEDHVSRKEQEKLEKRTNEHGQKSGQESWGKDSGARDLSPEIHKITSSAGNDKDIATSSMLSLARKLQNAALSALKIEVEELSSRLKFSERERESLQRKFSDAVEEKEQAQKRLQIIGSAHESRITELHCVIAELTKKIKTRQDNAIVEENEQEGSVSELSFQEGSVYNSEMEIANYDNDSRADSPGECHNNVENLQKENTSNNHSTTNNSAQIQALQEEIIHLRVQVALLQSQIASENENVCENNKNDVGNDKDGQLSDAISCDEDVDDLSDENDRSEFVKNQKTEINSKGTTNLHIFSSNETPVAKMAERVSLRRTITTTEDKNLTTSNLTNTSGIFTTDAAEHLASDLLEAETPSDGVDSSSYQLNYQIQRLQNRLEHSRLQNSVLTLRLNESKAHCEKLYLLCGKYESNAIALHQALNYCDRTIEGYDVLLALLESKVATLEGDESALDNQKITETVGKNLLLRLESESSIPVNSVGPWQNTDGICSNNSLDSTPWTEEDYMTLQNLVSKYKALRQLVQNTCVQLESPFFENSKYDSRDQKEYSIHREHKRMDLETAVLMEELMGLREEVTDLKFRLEQSEKGRTNSEKRAGALHDALLYMQAQLDDTEILLAKAKKNRPTYTESEHAVGIERELVEALSRESRLKARLQCLTNALHIATKTSEEKYDQVQNTVVELKQANLTLTQSLEKCKRKYQTRLKNLEQKLLGIQMNKSQQSSHSSELQASVQINKLRDGEDIGIDEHNSTFPETTL